MKLTINGEEKSFNQNLTIEELLKRLGVADKAMAVAVNMEIVKKEEWKKYRPKDGDKIEILGFTGGG